MSQRENITIDDLNAAINWLEDGYEGEDETLHSLLKVAAFLGAEVDRRRTNKAIRAIMKRTDCTMCEARDKLNEVRGR